MLVLFLLVAGTLLGTRCTRRGADVQADQFPAVRAAFGTHIDLSQLANYAAQPRPAYITKDNTGANIISDAKATLGRVLFYDKSLSIDNSISCGSCHRQTFAFSDTALQSAGVAGGRTGRHSMRLINARFAQERRFFWDERAQSLEAQTTMPIQDHAEMGFSGQNGRPGLPALLTKLQGLPYYNELFRFVYGDIQVTESRMQECLSQFIRSIQSFDSKYDAGRAQAPNDGAPFANFTQQENQGKGLFLAPPQFDATGSRTGGGLGCGGCHRAPEFDIDPNSRNNGHISSPGSTIPDLNNTRSPSLRDLLRPDGIVNGPMMHNGIARSLRQAVEHYNNITLSPLNTNLDPRLRPNGFGQRLQLTPQETDAVVAFLRTLSGTQVYSDARWSDPFR